MKVSMNRPASDRPQSAVQRLFALGIAKETDVVTARKRARELAGLLGFGHQDQIRIATSTSEITRNAVQYAGSGLVEFSLDPGAERALFLVRVSDRGPGISERDAIFDDHYNSQAGIGFGLIGTRRLMDRFSLESRQGEGTTVTFGKFLPLADKPDLRQLAALSEQLARECSQNPIEEIQQSNQELLAALDTVRTQELELERRETELERLNQELEDTNRGVVALYAELDDRAAALRRADEVKSRFLSHMSHEFRTPLNSILALTSLLIRRVDGELTSEQEKQVTLVRRSAQELLEMVNDLLDMAKVEAGKVDLRWGRIEVYKLLGALRVMMRPLATPEAVTLTFDDPPEDLVLHSDEGKLGQILRNLISNALKFTERGEVRVSVVCEETHIVFSVIDTGIGIAREDQERIFQEFSQVEHALQQKVRGTGLGLPLSRKLSELLGGTLSVTSATDIGSTFSLRLPLSAVESANDPGRRQDEASTCVSDTKASIPSQSSPGSILVIDDEEVSRYLVRQLFRGTHYVITEAGGGVEGLERARFDQPRLIILDLAMPDRNGFDVLKDLKADPATEKIPVVVHTSRILQAEDLDRLGGRHAAVWPKQVADHEQAAAFIREVLGEPHLFAN
jgi:signal transduction histidine kinase/ActR/RegA family two-component response regulator